MFDLLLVWYGELMLADDDLSPHLTDLFGTLWGCQKRHLVRLVLT